MAPLALGAPCRRLLSATLLSNLGDGIRAAAFPLLAASLTRSPILISGVAIAGELPGLLLSLAAGSLADRFNRRRLIIVVDAVRLMLLLALIAMITLGWATIMVLYVVVFVSAVAEELRDTTAGTLVPSIVAVDQLDRANGRMITAEIAGNEFIGPPLGGYLFGVAMVLPFAINGGTLAIAVALVASIPALIRPKSSAVGQERGRAGVRAGLRWFRDHRSFSPIPATTIALAMTDSAWFTILVLYIREVLHLQAVWYGILLAIGAVGGLAGGFLAARMITYFGGKITTLGCLVLALLGQLLLGTTSSVIATAAVLASSSAAFAIWNVLARTAAQRTAPPELLVRVNGIQRTVIATATLIGAALGGLSAHGLGLHAPFLLGIPLLVGAIGLVAVSKNAFAGPSVQSAR